MSTHKSVDGTIVFVCNGCGEELDTDTIDFQWALGRLRELQWRVKKNHLRIPPRWEHYCYLCKTYQGAA